MRGRRSLAAEERLARRSCPQPNQPVRADEDLSRGQPLLRCVGYPTDASGASGVMSGAIPAEVAVARKGTEVT
jgi:hypothetical protein